MCGWSSHKSLESNHKLLACLLRGQSSVLDDEGDTAVLINGLAHEMCEEETMLLFSTFLFSHVLNGDQQAKIL